MIRFVPKLCGLSWNLFAVSAGTAAVAETSSITESSAISVGLIVVIVGGLIAVTAWINQKVGQWDARLEEGNRRLQALEDKMDTLPCHDPQGNVCPPAKVARHG